VDFEQLLSQEAWTHAATVCGRIAQTEGPRKWI
jgi:hypothetical protein